MSWDEEQNAVKQLGELMGYDRLIHHASVLKAEPLKPIDLSRGHCAHGVGLAARCRSCEKDALQQTPGA